MIFEEEFPSLKDQEWKTNIKSERMFGESDIQEHCLDKQKVFEELERFKDLFINHGSFRDRYKVLLERLRLE